MIIIFLKQFQKIKKQIEEKEELLAQMEALATKSTSSIKKINIAPTNLNYDKTGDTVSEIADLKTDIDKTRKNLFRIEKQIRFIITNLPLRKMQNIMIDRYIYCLKWQDIAINNSCNERHARRLHARALKYFNAHIYCMSASNYDRL